MTEKVAFGVKLPNGNKVELATIELDFPQLLFKRRISMRNNFYMVNVYFDRPEFFISRTRDDKNRQVLEVMYPKKDPVQNQ